jgi:WD40 repeat protein
MGYKFGLRLWDVETGACLRIFKGHTGNINSVAFSSDGCYALSSGHDNTLRLWEVKTGACLRTLQIDLAVKCATFRPDNHYALSGNLDVTLQFWKLEGVRTFHAPFYLAKPLSGFQASAQEQVYRKYIDQARQALQRHDIAAALHSARQVRSLSGYERNESALEIWSALYQHCRIRGIRGAWNTKSFKGHEGWVETVSFSPDGHYALSGSSDRTLRLWDVEMGACLRVFEGHKGGVTSVAFSPGGRYALSGSWDNNLRLWEVATGTCLRVFEGHKNKVISIAVSPDGRYALSGSRSIGDDCGLRIWEIGTGNCLRLFEKGRDSKENSVAFSPDGQHALSSSHLWNLNLWDVKTGECLQTFDGHQGGGEVNSVAFSPDRRFALSGSDDKTMCLWDADRGARLRTFEGHEGAVHSVAFSPDGRFVLSGSGDKTLRLWELGTGVCLRIFEGHELNVSSVAFSPDGRYALSGSGDWTLKLWALDWELEDYQPADWDEGASPYLDIFLTLHTPCAGTLPQDRAPTEEEVNLALTRRGKPVWTKVDFEQLLYTLGCTGYGWLRPEGVRRKLEEMSKER